MDHSPNRHPEASPPEPQHHPVFIHHIWKLFGSWEHLTSIRDAILANSLEITTDGSYNPITTRASCSWVFWRNNNTIHSGLSRITSQNRNAYRTELLGLLAALYIIQYVEEEYLETEDSISLVSDCGNALKCAFRWGPITVKDATQDEFDIILDSGVEDDYLHPPVITVLHNNVPLTRGLPQQIITDVHYDPLKRKLQKDNGWTEETFLSVD